MVSRSNGLLHSIGQGYSALDAQAGRDKLDGFAVVSGLSVTPASSGLAVDVASGTSIHGESSGSVNTASLGSTTQVSLSTADSTHPRKDTIFIDNTGTVNVEAGTAESANPEGNARFETYEPEPPRPPNDTDVILAEVWVAAGATSLASADVRDRRAPADVVADDVTARNVDTDEENNTKWVRPGDTIQTVINDASSEFDHAKVKIAGGTTFTESGIDVPGDVTVEAEGGYAASPTVEPAADEYVFDVANTAQLRGLRIDTTNISGYSSRAVRFDASHNYDGGTKNLADCQVLGTTGSTNGDVGIALVDESGNETTHVVVEDCFVQGFDSGVELLANATNAAVNANRIDVMLRACRRGIVTDAQTGVVRGNELEAMMNGSTNTDYAYVIGGDFNRWQTGTFDAGTFNNGAFDVKSGVVDNHVHETVMGSAANIDGATADIEANTFDLQNVGLPNDTTFGTATFKVAESSTQAVSAGGTAIVGPFTATNEELLVAYTYDSSAGSDVKVEYRLLWNQSGGNVRVEFDETTGNTDCTVDYTILRLN